MTTAKQEHLYGFFQIFESRSRDDINQYKMPMDFIMAKRSSKIRLSKPTYDRRGIRAQKTTTNKQR